MYDTRIYNIDTGQKDIKIMKRIDFEGAYILYNQTKNIYYSGHSKKVLRKIDRHFRGYENIDLYVDYTEGDEFFVKIKPLDPNDSLSVIDLEKELIIIYDEKVSYENNKRKIILEKNVEKKKNKEFLGNNKEKNRRKKGNY